MGVSRIDELTARAERYAGETASLSDALWAEPELRWREHAAVERLSAVARAHGLRVTRELAGVETAFSAEGGEGGPVIAILGEYDALDGMSQRAGAVAADPLVAGAAGHACGHNLLGPGALLATVIAAEHLRERGLPGRVRFVGCPAEEAASGKTVLVQRGAFDDVSIAATWHPADHLSARQYLTLAYAQLDIAFEGVAAHAGVAPELGRSALDALELCNVGVNYLREHVPDGVRLHYAVTDAGGESPNVVPAHARGRYIVRAREVGQLTLTRERVERIARGAALMTDTRARADLVGASSQLLPNTPLEGALDDVLHAVGPVPFDEADRAAAAAYAPGAGAPLDGRAREWADAPRAQTGASTDVGDISWTVPTVMLTAPTMAVGTPVHSWQLVAQGTLSPAHRGTRHAAVALAELALRVLEDDGLREAALRAHRADVAAAGGYTNPLPTGFVPTG